MNLINFLAKTYCASGTTLENIPEDVVNIIHIAYVAIRYGVAAILIFVGMLGLGKAITQQKEDEIKKAQSLLVKQAITALIVILLPTLILWVFKTIDSKSTGFMGCIENVLNNNECSEKNVCKVEDDKKVETDAG